MQTSLSELKTSGFWYLASPYSHPDPLTREHRALSVNDTSAKLLSLGIHVYSPIWAAHRAAMHFDLPKDHVFWLAFNKAFIDPAVGILVADIDGWRESAGCNQEIEYGLATGKPVFLLDNLLGLRPLKREWANMKPGDELSMDARFLFTAWFGFGSRTSVKVGGEGAQSVMTARATAAMKELVDGGYVTASVFNRFGRMEYVGTEKCTGLKLSLAKMQEFGGWSPTEPKPALKKGGDA